MGKFSIVSLGCPKNLVDSDNLIAQLREEGFLYTPDPEEADAVLVNTCGFIEEARRESIDEILRLTEIKKKGKKLMVFGCLAQRYRDELQKELAEIDALWGVGEDDKIVEYFKKDICRAAEHVLCEGGAGIRGTADDTAMVPASQTYAYLKIAEGCSRGCTYCVIPSIRGPFKSAGPESILRRAEEHIAEGKKELILIAQDIGSYGREFGGYGLSSLVKDVAALRGDFWVRLLYLYPTAITDELLTVIADHHKVCRYLDMPLQHSEDRILRAMGRSGTKAMYKEAIRKIRERMPGITLRTTIIVGFPGEAEEDFRGLRDFVEEMQFDRLGVFTYSKEEGTAASKMRGAVSRKIKEARKDEIMRLQARISLERNRALIGKDFRALVDEGEGRGSIARLSSQAPEIDGVVFIDGADVKKGDFVNVSITEAYDYDLRGEASP